MDEFIVLSLKQIISQTFYIVKYSLNYPISVLNIHEYVGFVQIATILGFNTFTSKRRLLTKLGYMLIYICSGLR